MRGNGYERKMLRMVYRVVPVIKRMIKNAMFVIVLQNYKNILNEFIQEILILKLRSYKEYSLIKMKEDKERVSPDTTGCPKSRAAGPGDMSLPGSICRAEWKGPAD